MSDDVISVHPDDGLFQVAERFLERSYHRYPVIEDRKLVGVISRRDVMQALAKSWQWE